MEHLLRIQTQILLCAKVADYNINSSIFLPLQKTLEYGINGTIYTIVQGSQSNGDIYIGGEFSKVGGISANNIVKYNTNTGQWDNLSTGVDGAVYAICCNGNDIYVGGKFTNSNTTVELNRIGLYNGTWNSIRASDSSQGEHTVGSGSTNDCVYSLLIQTENTGNTLLYIGGSFTAFFGEMVNNILIYDTTTKYFMKLCYNNLYGLPSSIVYALCFYNSSIYIGNNNGIIIFTATTSVTQWARKHAEQFKSFIYCNFWIFCIC